MAVQQFRVKRGGIEKTGEVGNLPGKSRLSTTTVEPQEPFQLPVKEGPARIVIDFDLTQLNGEAIRLETTWAKGYVTPSGALSEVKKGNPMLTNPTDLANFADMLAGVIMRFCMNGKVRSLEGHNDKPVFNAQGVVITYTEEQENEEPTGGYWPQPMPPTQPA